MRKFAVDVDAGAGDVVAVVGSEPDGGAGDILDLADPLVRRQAHQVPHRPRHAPRLMLIGVRIATRRDGIDADARGRPPGDALHHQRNPALRHHVVGVRTQGMTSYTELDVRILPAEQDTAGCTRSARTRAPPRGHEELAGQDTDIHHPVPLRQRHLLESGVLLQPGIVDEDVDGAELPAHPVEHLSHVVFAGDVAAMCVAAGAASPDLVDDRLRLGIVFDVVHHHIGAGMPEADRDPLADPGTGAGNERLLPFSFFSIGQAGITTGGNVGSFISGKSTSSMMGAPLDRSGRETGAPRPLAFPY